jgi:hypothetical protein
MGAKGKRLRKSRVEKDLTREIPIAKIDHNTYLVYTSPLWIGTMKNDNEQGEPIFSEAKNHFFASYFIRTMFNIVKTTNMLHAER